MNFPDEIEYKIINFIPFTRYIRVNRLWEKEIIRIQKKSCKKIISWYRKRRCPSPFHFNPFFPKTVHNMLRSMIVHWHPYRFLSFPEHVIEVLAANEDILSVLKPIKERTTRDVYDWMINMPLIVDDFKYVLMLII